MGNCKPNNDNNHVTVKENIYAMKAITEINTTQNSVKTTYLFH
jgi:hypothetical protein